LALPFILGIIQAGFAISIYKKFKLLKKPNPDKPELNIDD
jgi:hypothetical protein